MMRTGSSSARSRIAAPVRSSPVSFIFAATTAGMACSSATPPPGTMPSSTAARVAESASSTRSFFSFSSTSVAAPTLMTATPPASFASRSCSFSRSKSDGGLFDLGLDLLDAALDRLVGAVAFDDRRLVLGRTMTRRARPRSATSAFSSLRPMSSVMNVPPVRMAMSSSIALRRSPKPGALTAQALIVPRSLLTTSVASASPSRSSADDDEVLRHLQGLLEHGQDVLDGADAACR